MKRKQALERFEAAHMSKPRLPLPKKVIADLIPGYTCSYKVRRTKEDRLSTWWFAEVLRQQFAAMVTKELRRRNISQAELSRLSGKQKSVIHRILQGKVNVTLRTIAEISFALGKVFIPKWRRAETC